MSGPLDGYRVIDLTTILSGPVATMILGDQGADVIKVEAPGGGDLLRHLGTTRGGLAALFVTSNRNKRSLVLNLSERRGVELLEHLVREADVFVQNFRPGAAERMGIGEEALRRVAPELIYVSISGFGESGPYASRRVYDHVIQALSGLASTQTDPGTGVPSMVRTLAPDKLTALTAAQAITAALLARERTGKGQHVRLAMLDATVAWLWPDGMANQTYIGDDVTLTPPFSLANPVFETADGYMTAGALSDDEWGGMARAVGHPEWISDPRFRSPADRTHNLEDLRKVAGQELKARTTAEWCERLGAEQVPCAPILSRDALIDDPQVAANGLLVEYEHPHAGRMREPRPAVRFDMTPAEIRRPAPALGEHTDEILGELGLSAAEIAEARDKGWIE